MIPSVWRDTKKGADSDSMAVLPSRAHAAREKIAPSARDIFIRAERSAEQLQNETRHPWDD